MRQLAVMIAVVVTVARGVWMAAAQAPAPAAPQKIGFIDIQRVLARSQAGVAAREQLEREKATMQKEMDTRRVDMEKLREEIEKKGPLMTAEVRREKQELFEKQAPRRGPRWPTTSRRIWRRRSRGSSRRSSPTCPPSSIAWARRRDTGSWWSARAVGVLYAANEADLTDEVIRAYDQDLQSKGPKK